MCPVMSNSPGEDWVPPLTVPPLPAAGVVGAVVLVGPTWMPPELLDDEPDEPEAVVLGDVVPDVVALSAAVSTIADR
jgi:hypothetical protein